MLLFAWDQIGGIQSSQTNAGSAWDNVYVRWSSRAFVSCIALVSSPANRMYSAFTPQYVYSSYIRPVQSTCTLLVPLLHKAAFIKSFCLDPCSSSAQPQRRAAMRIAFGDQQPKGSAARLGFLRDGKNIWELRRGVCLGLFFARC